MENNLWKIKNFIKKKLITKIRCTQKFFDFLEISGISSKFLDTS
jgi:hypothetical protein